MVLPAKPIRSFREFYPFYLAEHSRRWTKRLHFIGTSLSLMLLIGVLVFGQCAQMLWLCPVVGYGFAWGSHFFIEKNKPATFTYPVWSLMGDFKLWMEIATLQRTF